MRFVCVWASKKLRSITYDSAVNMDGEGLIDNDYLAQVEGYPSYTTDGNRNGRGVANGFRSPQSSSKELGSLISGQRNLDLSSTTTFDQSRRVILGWENVNVFVHQATRCFHRCLKPRGNMDFVVKQILIEVNGEIPERSLVAIMGPRGAGKTTLLNVLAHRKIEKLEVTGTVFTLDEPVGIEIREMSCYVEERDIFVGSLTVYEHLLFQALLRMDKNVSSEERKARVREIMAEFDLKEWADILIGNPGEQYSIPRGIMKSLSIASELLANEKILLFADDPLSGLDNLSACELMEKLQRLTENGYTIICTVDHPSSDVYAMFDQTIFLADGKIAFLGSSREATNHFGSIGFPCPSYFNPADFFIRKLTVVPKEYEESQERVQFICSKYKEIEIRPRAKSSLGPIESFEDPDKKATVFKAGRFSQFLVLLWRCFLTIKRENTTWFFRTIQAIVLGLIAGQVYFQLDKDQEDIRNVTGILYFLVLNITFSSYQGVLFTFPVETDIFLRENEKGVYCTTVYFLAKSLVEIPIYSILTIILISIAYWMSGLYETSEAFLLACGIALLICHTAVSFGYLVTTATDSLSSAIATGPILMLPLLMFGGFFVSNNTIPASLKWLRYLSWFNFAFENFMINQWRHVDTISGCGKTTSEHCLRSGREILDFYQLDEDNFKRNFWFLAALLLFYRIIAYAFLLHKARRVRSS